MQETSFLFYFEMDKIGRLEVRYIARLTVQFLICECMSNVASSLSRNGYFIIIDNISSTSYFISGKRNFIKKNMCKITLLYLGLFSLPRWAQGFSKQSVVFIDTVTACYMCGNHIIFLNIDSKKRTVFQSPGKGIGAFTASGTSRVVAVSEQRLNPSIFVLSYPGLKLKHELKGSDVFSFSVEDRSHLFNML